LAVVVTLLACNATFAAEADDDKRVSGAGISVVAAVETDIEQDEPTPLAFTPPVMKAFTPEDLPPPNLFAKGYLHVSSGAFGRNWRAGASEYSAIVDQASAAYGVPPALLDAVMAVESRYNPSAVGMDGEIGLMQVMPATARMLGFTGTQAQLADSKININYGARYLAGAWRLAGQDICTAAMKYRAGHGETRFSFLSVEYCVRIRNHLMARGVVVTGAVPQPTFGAPAGTRRQGRSVQGSLRGGVANLTALNERLRVLTDRIASHKFR
jgi:hypothetical protein